jgi:hypothetical protein
MEMMDVVLEISNSLPQLVNIESLYRLGPLLILKLVRIRNVQFPDISLLLNSLPLKECVLIGDRLKLKQMQCEISFRHQPSKPDIEHISLI